jgi:hypothetical protein
MARQILAAVAAAQVELHQAHELAARVDRVL